MKIDANKDLAQAQIQNAGKGRESADVKPLSSASSILPPKTMLNALQNLRQPSKMVLTRSAHPVPPTR